MEIKRLVGLRDGTTDIANRSTRVSSSQQLALTPTRAASRSVSIDPMTPLSQVASDMEFPTSTGVRTEARANLARQWSDGSA
uniref:Uncharacterized protein n=1 Tax=Peronospora matthiolae TaxID=2874970 RepID=A0AAV1TL52_9STRA